MEQQKPENKVSFPESKSLGLDSGDLASRFRRREVGPPQPFNRAPRYMTEVRERRMAVMPNPSPQPAQYPVQAQQVPVAPAPPIPAVESLPPVAPVIHQEPAVEVPVVEMPVPVDVHPLVETRLLQEEPLAQNKKFNFRLPRLRKLLIEGSVVGVLLFMSVATYSIITHTPGKAKTVTATVEAQLAYDVLVPYSDRYTVQDETLDYNTRTEVFSYVISRKDGLKVYINQMPDNKNTKKEYGELIKDKITKVATKNGLIDVAIPKRLNGGQAVLGNMNGTLLFARTEKQMLDSDWTELIDSLRVKAD